MNGDGTPVSLIAKDIGLPVKEVLARLKEHGVNVRSGSSKVTSQVERGLRGSYDPHSLRKPEPLARAAVPEDVAVHTRSTAPASPQAGKKTARNRPIRPRRSGYPFVSKEQQIAKWEARKPPLDPDKVRKRIQELNTPERRGPKSETEQASDDAARHAMRSRKPSSWLRGRSPGSYS